MRLSVRLLVLTVLTVLAACTHNDPETGLATTNARVASTGLRRGDCVEARARAAQRPDLPVDRLPAPVKMAPAPLVNVPASALRKDGSSEIKVDVLIDTLGRADMRTFKVVRASSPWLAENVRSVIGKWRFTPAQLAGCKVARVYHFMASSPSRNAEGR